ncbi:unnamed protein product [Echinostoma caproni]|uniref:Transportin-3 n=1 Tax=Echinostoma caproni TaxID=27848 RepID=A0A183B3V2_9TREM|nr:unnamed protein product [Echinostoma caproni]
MLIIPDVNFIDTDTSFAMAVTLLSYPSGSAVSMFFIRSLWLSSCESDQLYSLSNSVGELITRNADYLISSITLQLHSVILRHPGTNTISPDLLAGLQSACQTMTTLFEHATFEILPLLRPMVRQVLSCLDLTYEQHVDLFLPALKRLVLTCRQWHAASQGFPAPSAFRTVEALEAKPVVKVSL